MIAVHRWRAVVVVLCAALISTACGAESSSAPALSPSPSATRPAAKTSSCAATPATLVATVRITSPKTGEVVPVGKVTVMFEAIGAELVAFQIARCPNDYHVHVVLDRDVSAYLGTDVPAPLTADFHHTPFATSDEPRAVTFSDVAAGQHTVVVWLATADHVSVKPAVSSSATFTVR